MMNHNVRTAEKSYFLRNRQSKVTGTRRLLSEALRRNHDFLLIHCQDILAGNIDIKGVCDFQKVNSFFSSINTKNLYDRLRYMQRKITNQSKSIEAITTISSEVGEPSEIINDDPIHSPCFANTNVESDSQIYIDSKTTNEEMHRYSTVFEDHFRALYTTGDVNLIHRYFREMIKSSKFIAKKVVISILDENKDNPSPIVQRFSFPSILMKIRREICFQINFRLF